MRKLIEINQEHVIECDNPMCDYSVSNPSGDPNVDISEYLNQECPKCGENLLTEEDLRDYKKVLKLINRMNWWFSWVTIFIPKKKKLTKASVKVHDGVDLVEKTSFTPFYFEGNMYYDLIDSKEKFNDLVEAYKGHGDLGLAKEYVGDMPRNEIAFGFYSEYQGKQTLGEWMKLNNII
jgi:hypothetical protein